MLLRAERLVTSDHVLAETWILLRHRLGRPAAESFWGGLRAGIARIEPATSADLERAWTIGRAFTDQDFSFVDRTSFAMMERLGIFRVAALDSDFSIYRFGPNRRRAFEVLS